MASFVANHRKKKEHLLDRENDLRRLLDREASNEKLLEAAIQVREARIRVARVKQVIGPQSMVDNDVRIRIEGEIASLQALSAEQVLAEFVDAKERKPN